MPANDQPERMKTENLVECTSVDQAAEAYEILIRHLVDHFDQGSQRERGLAIYYLTCMWMCLRHSPPDFKSLSGWGAAYAKSLEEEYLDVPDWWRRQHRDVSRFVLNLWRKYKDSEADGNHD